MQTMQQKPHRLSHYSIECLQFEATRRKYNIANNLQEVMRLDESSIPKLINFVNDIHIYI